MLPHHEHHLTSSAALRDFVIGMSDGLTVPFALAAGLSGAVDSTAIIVTAGMAEIAAGAISMGLGGYLSAKTERDHYESEKRREESEVEKLPHVEAKEVSDILSDFGVPPEQLPVVAGSICQHPKQWVDFMMRFELGLERPDPHRLVQSPLIIGGAYAVAGLVPLAPYVAMRHVIPALHASIAVSLLALFAFGAFKGYYTGQKVLKSALQTMVIGSAAAAAAFFIARLVS
ncbi:MAG: VIT1/CCC1 transporter family protein [Pseudomonadota bacterium]|nr:VIT1/CCC1 transporter family protein [Pseudomonadota bacterium]MDE3037411.1 VIT1/CCC1 transporter family protein [Pseudomonadota bacterium]